MQVLVFRVVGTELQEKINEALADLTNATVVAVIQNKLFEYTVVIQHEGV